MPSQYLLLKIVRRFFWIGAMLIWKVFNRSIADHSLHRVACLKYQQDNREIPIIDSGLSPVYINFRSYLMVRKVGMKMVSTNPIFSYIGGLLYIEETEGYILQYIKLFSPHRTTRKLIFIYLCAKFANLIPNALQLLAA